MLGIIYQSFFKRLPVRPVRADSYLHLLSDTEVKTLRNLHWWLISCAALCSVIGFLLYFLPLYAFPDWFCKTNLQIAGQTYSLPLRETVWGIWLMIIEITILVLLNLYGVHETAVITGYITPTTKSTHTAFLLDIGLGGQKTKKKDYGINPFQGIPAWQLFLYNTFMQLKGWLGNKVLRLIAQRLLGRYAIRAVLDFIGMPIYMAINAYSAWVVLHEAKMIIMGQTLIDLTIKQFPTAINPSEKDLVYDALQYIAISKRDFHINHLYLARCTLAHFQIPEEENHLLPANFFEKLSAAAPTTRRYLLSLIKLGYILDGHISLRERKAILELNKQQLLDDTPEAIRVYAHRFVAGKGLDNWI